VPTHPPSTNGQSLGSLKLRLTDQRTEHHQRTRNLWCNDPGPERHRHQAEGKPGKALDKPSRQSTDEYDGGQGIHRSGALQNSLYAVPV
jgi:hypothetical protein